MAAQREPESESRSQQEREGGMMPIIQEVQRTHLSVVPTAADPVPQPFTSTVMLWLWVGILVGGFVGLVFGAALFRNTIAIRGWEALFSLGPFTFHVFWTMAGMVLGIATLGAVGILTAKPNGHFDNEVRPKAKRHE